MSYCKACGGTGLYKGFAEKEGCAVVCNQCNGNGFKKTASGERKLCNDVKRVFAHSAGFVHAATGKYKNEKTGKWFNFEDGGCTYQEWLAGLKPQPVKTLYCPYLWTQQELQTRDKNGLYENHCGKHLHLGSITDCNRYPKMHECWNIFENKDAYLEALKLKNIISDYDLDNKQLVYMSFANIESDGSNRYDKWFDNEDNFLEFLLYIKEKLFVTTGVFKNIKNVMKVYHPEIYQKYKLLLDGE